MVENNYRLRFLIAICIATGAFFNAPVVEASADKNSTSSACLLKYDSLSLIMCEKNLESEGDILGMVAPITNATASDSAMSSSDSTQQKKEEKKLGVKEVKGVQKEYEYTNRVVKGKTKYYTMTRKHPDVESDRLEVLVNGDKVRAIKLDQSEKWYFVEIFKSHDPELEGKQGWIEAWLVDDEQVPVKPSPTPTRALPTPSAELVASTASAPAPVTGSADGEAMFAKINAHRASIGLPAYEKSPRLCSIAAQRAPEIHNEVFGSGYIHQGFNERGYNASATENMVAMGGLDANFNWWMNSGIHRRAIESPSYKYSCGECVGGGCVQIFSSQP